MLLDLMENKVIHAGFISCFRYKYHFPFLETNGIVSVDDNRVGPLYKHVFPPHLAPWLSFVGLPCKVYTKHSSSSIPVFDFFRLFLLIFVIYLFS